MRVSMASFALSVRMFTTKGGVQSIKYTYSVSHYYTRFIEIIEDFQFDKFFKLLIFSDDFIDDFWDYFLNTFMEVFWNIL